MKNLNSSIPFVLIFSILTGACNLPAAGPEVADAPQSAEEGLAASLSTPTPTAAAQLVQDCSPIVTTTTVANVRGGPGTNYNIVGAIPLGGTAPVAGKNADSTWWYIQFAGGPGGYAWIAASVTTATCIPATLAIIAAPPAPAAANNPAPADSDEDEPEVAEEPPPPSATPTSSGGLWTFPGIIIKIPSPTPTFVMPDFDIDIPEIDIPGF
jgi:uncharacterized protein YraI